MNIATYDAKDTSIVVDGVYITGLGEEMYSAERNEDFFTSSAGAQGDVVRSVTNDPRGKFTLHIQPTSPSKAFLMSLAKRSEPFSIWAVNKRLGERTGGTKASLLTFPSIERGAEAADMEFVFEVFDFEADATL